MMGAVREPDHGGEPWYRRSSASEAASVVAAPRSAHRTAGYALRRPSVRVPSCLVVRLLTLAACLTSGAGLVASVGYQVPFLGLPAVGWLVLLALAVIVQRQAAGQAARVRAEWERAAGFAGLATSLIGAFAMVTDAKEQHEEGHAERVRDLALRIGRKLGLPETELDALGTAAMLHDIGTLAVPDHILSKPDRLTDEEMRKVQTHTLVGAALLESAPFPGPVVPIVRSHHERHDGSGYPDRLSGEAIPLGARILALADVYESLISSRPYREALPVREAVEFLRQRSGTHFDSEVLEAGLRVLAEPKAAVLTQAAAPVPSHVYQHIQQASREMLTLYETVQAVSRSLGAPETLELVTRRARETTAADMSVLFVRQEGDFVLAAAASGAFADHLKGQRLRLGWGLSGSVAQTGLPSGPGRLAQEDLGLLAANSPWQHQLVHALSAPLVNELGSIGALTLYRAADASFTEDDARLLATVAEQATLAVSHAREYEQARQSALTDGLTGLANGRHFRLQLEEELDRARREKRPLSLIAIDLDGLKHVNDTHGHQAGDRVLRTVAQVFLHHVREVDTVVRYAGDEFFIIVPGVPHGVIAEMQHRLKAAVRATSVEVTPGTRVGLSASFGTATFPGDAEYAEALIAVADAAMYADKRLNRQAALIRAGVGRTETRPEETAENAATRVAAPLEGTERGDARDY